MKNPSPFATRGRHGDRTVKRVKRQDGFVEGEYCRNRLSWFEALAFSLRASPCGRNSPCSNTIKFDFESRDGFICQPA